MHAGEVVAVGGGHGLARVLAALGLLGVEPVAVVTVADDGGSSGRLRRDLGIIAPGDLRQALVTLARNQPLADLFGHRFSRGELAGHALGNLALVALAERSADSPGPDAARRYDFVAAVDAAGALLDCAGRVLPATTEPVELHAEVADGRQVDGQARVTQADGRVTRVWLEPDDPPAADAAVEALRLARTVVLGPGSLFTSVIAPLLVPGVRKALVDTRARTIYIANLTTQPGETSGFSAHDHVAALLDHVPELRLDSVVLHAGPVPAGTTPVRGPLDNAAGAEVVTADLVSRAGAGTPAPGHDPSRLGRALAPLLGLPLP